MKSNKPTCKSCVHFIQHYFLDTRRFRWLNCGHCTKIKNRHIDCFSKVCAHYSYAEPDENRFVSKEYLSKELLNYALSLELLPPLDPCEECQETPLPVE